MKLLILFNAIIYSYCYAINGIACLNSLLHFQQSFDIFATAVWTLYNSVCRGRGIKQGALNVNSRREEK